VEAGAEAAVRLANARDPDGSERPAAAASVATLIATQTADHRLLALAERLAEVVVPGPLTCGDEVEWLPVMRVGHAGERNHAGVCAKPGHTGHLVYGPYARLGAGDYRVRVCWSAGRPLRTVQRDQPIATIEAVSRYGKTYLAQRELLVEDYDRPEHDLLFHVGGRPSPTASVEVRVWTSGIVPLTVSSIAVELVDIRSMTRSRG